MIELFNKFTSEALTNRLKASEVQISWDGRGRFWDNIFIERLWRGVKYDAKYEEVYLKDYANVPDHIYSLIRQVLTNRSITTSDYTGLLPLFPEVQECECRMPQH